MADILQFPTTIERVYAERGKRFRDEIDARIAAVIADTNRDIRIMRFQRFVGIACVVVVVFALCWFAGQLGRGALL